MNNLNKKFIISMLIAVIGTVFSTATQLPIALICLLSIAPLIYYFITLLIVSKQGLSQSGIDSIYYFGFLVTIASLASSVLTVAIHGLTKDLNLIITQFGIGLLATGLALAFRMVLIARIENINQKDITEAIKEYVEKIDNVVHRIEATSESFDALSRSLIERTEKAFAASNDSYQKNLVETSKITYETFTNLSRDITIKFTELIESNNKSLLEFDEILSQIKLKGHAKDIITHSGQISKGLQVFSDEISEFSKKTFNDININFNENNKNSIHEFNTIIQELSLKTKNTIEESLNSFKDINISTDVASFKNQLFVLSKSVTLFSKRLDNLDLSFNEVIKNTVNETTSYLTDNLRDNIDLLKDEYKSISKQINDVNSSIIHKTQSEVQESVKLSIESLSSEWKNLIANSSNDFQEKIKNIHNSVVQLENSIDLKDVMDNFDNLSKLINRAGSEVEQFSSALDHTTNTIKNSTSSLSSLTTVDDANLQK